MTYFGFLAYFLCIPITILAVVAWWDGRRGRTMPAVLNSWSPYAAIAAHAVVALLYTTPWDNYLVATRVWWYRPELVTGIVFGWVPIEEYTFFILQPILTGLWFVFLARRLSRPRTPIDGAGGRWFRWGGLVVCTVVWLWSVSVLWNGSQPLTYLALLMAWVLPPVMLQLGFGGDILWHFRKLVLLTLLPASVYLSVADATAIESGTWTINPAQSVNFLVGSLPIEEIVFFLMTNVLITFGMTLVLARASQERAPKGLLSVLNRLAGRTDVAV